VMAAMARAPALEKWRGAKEGTTAASYSGRSSISRSHRRARAVRGRAVARTPQLRWSKWNRGVLMGRGTVSNRGNGPRPASIAALISRGRSAKSGGVWIIDCGRRRVKVESEGTLQRRGVAQPG
jgi:hypothetical protein